MTDENMSPESYQAREMYAHYGLALYLSQVLEATLKSAIVLAQLTSDPTATRQKFDNAWESNFSVTMGRLIKRFTPYLNGDDELEEDLRLALAIRNHLAHHFFWDNAAKAMTMQGQAELVEECSDAMSFFEEVDQRLERVVAAYYTAHGTPADLLAARIATAQEELLGRPSTATTCGRCGGSLDAAGSARRPYKRCQRCGASTFFRR